MKKIFVLLITVVLFSCVQNKEPQKDNTSKKEVLKLTLEQANHLAELPLKCMQKEYPNKLGQTLSSKDDLGTPKELHPAFYGCFDWHSSVHGHWMLIKLLKSFPNLEKRELIEEKLKQNLTAENIKGEIDYFSRKTENSYERTYGWAWLLKLAEELHTWDNPMAKELEHNLQPLTDTIVQHFIDFLPRLRYPIRVGEHTNTAFGLAFAWDYANTTNNTQLKSMIDKRARDFYYNDMQCPLSWEPSGFDFLSPCLEEADLMRRVLSKDEFRTWLEGFLPQLSDPNFKLKPAEIIDRTDGKLVHLDGLNFSRAWCLYGIANDLTEYSYLKDIANEHIAYSLPHVVGDGYEGAHWLASFAIYALSQASE
jgi:hypothetical protein